MVIRFAFTMIELIFAIVIISITVVSLPMLMQVTQKSNEASVDQELIFIGSKLMNDVLSESWDEHSIDPTPGGKIPDKVVQIPGGTAKFLPGNVDMNRSFRVGHIRQDNHRKLHSDPTANEYNVSTLGDDNTAVLIVGMEEHIGANKSLTGETGGTIAQDSYKNQGMTYSVEVNYIDDNTSAPFVFSDNGHNTPSNMRLVTIRINDATGNEKLVLRSYAANIGEEDYFYRDDF